MERFAHSHFSSDDADELIAKQYKYQPMLRPIYNAVVAAAQHIGPVNLQARKTYVSLLTRRRTFARVQATKARVDLGLRLEAVQPAGRLLRSTIHETMRVRIALASVHDVDAEVVEWLTRAYRENS